MKCHREFCAERACSRSSLRILLVCISFSFGSFAEIASAQTAPDSKFSKIPQAYETTKDIPYGVTDSTDDYTKERRKLDIYLPKGMKDFPTIVWFHGGGLTGGSKSIPKGLQDKGFAVVAPNYRLSPRVKSPAYIEDAAAAVAWTFENIEKYGGSKSKIIVGGISAGGYLSLMIGLDKSWLSKHGIDADSIAALVPISGQTITHFTVRAEKGIPDKRPVVDEMAPLFHVRKDSPPMLLVTGDPELEMLGRAEENAYLARMMKIAGHTRTTLYRLEGFDHGGIGEASLPLVVKFVRGIQEERNGNANLDERKLPATASRMKTRKISGWTVHVNERLLAEEMKSSTSKAMELLERQLNEIVKVVPAEAVAKLRQVPLWFSPEYPGVAPKAEYHPDAGWLKDNGRDTAMAKGVEFTNVRIFERETARMPNFALHELAHAYHDRFLSGGFANAEVAAAFENAKAMGLYENVQRTFGDGRTSKERAYAMTNPMEYFAECTESYFAKNDFYPFTRDELNKYDTRMTELLQQLWGEAQPAKNSR
ncbi:alpha/beta hydrolase fold domain-containing protein [bacterium]|nr:alpha/beta hydrolase fold domain-containing protein [bacterium]